MSTCAQILVAGESVSLYRHSDGYPQGRHGVVGDLLPFLVKFVKFRGGFDPPYLMAQLVHHLVAKEHRFWAKRARLQFAGRDRDYYESTKYIGYALLAVGDEADLAAEWVYVIQSNHLEVRKANRRGATKLVRRLAFDGTPFRLTRKRKAKVVPAVKPSPAENIRNLEI